MFNSNEPIKAPHLQKLANQSMLNGAFVIEMVNNSFSETKRNFGENRPNRPKKKDIASEKYTSTRLR